MCWLLGDTKLNWTYEKIITTTRNEKHNKNGKKYDTYNTKKIYAYALADDKSNIFSCVLTKKNFEILNFEILSDGNVEDRREI